MTDLRRAPVARTDRSRLSGVAKVVMPGCLALLTVATFVARAGDVPLADLLRDTTTTLDAPSYIGLVSNAGILLWAACTTICLFTATVLSRTRRPAVGTGAGAAPDTGASAGAGFFLAGAGVSAWLLLDDALLLHEQVLPDYLGLPGELSLVVLACATLAFLIAHRRTVLAGDYPLLITALVLLAISAGIDQLYDLHLIGALFLHSDALETLIEDSFKLFGIAFWSSYFALAAHDRLVRPEASTTS